MSQYHEGEREAQRLAGEQDIAASRDGMMQPRIAAAAARWVRAQTLLAMATLDAEGRPWATLVTGDAGFLHADDGGGGLWIDHKFAGAVSEQVKANSSVGLLAIDLSTRQRLRVNGRAHSIPSGLYVSVAESFFNCPKYIARRFALPSRDAVSVSGPLEGTELPAEHWALLSATDVLFLATGHPERGLDVSHRGGDAGFVELLPDGRIRLPDYPGNSLFNSLGNLLVDPRIGVAAPDLRTGEVLQITGRAVIAWHDDDPTDSSGGTHRFLTITQDAWRVVRGGPVASSSAEPSPYNPHAHSAG